MIKIDRQRQVGAVTVYNLKVDDGYHQRRFALERLGSQLFAGRLEAYLSKRPHLEHSHTKNRARKLLYALPSFPAWAALMPGALALEPIHNPRLKKLPTGQRLDPLTRRLFRHGLDPIGVRSRTLIGGWLAKQYVAEHRVNNLNWLSLAGGTAAPAMLMAQASGVNFRSLRYTNIDSDGQSIKLASDITASAGLMPSNTKLVQGDVFDHQTITKVVQPSTADIIDMMGIFEYLDDAASKILLKDAYRLLRPGGIIITCNMRAEHPQLHLHKRGVGWPGVIPRTLTDIVKLARGAKIGPEQLSIYCSRDGVYNVVRITKS